MNNTIKHVFPYFIFIEILKLHSLSVSVRSISNRLNISRGTVARYFKENNLIANGKSRQIVDIINAEKGKCKSCKIIKPIEEFIKKRIDRTHENHFSSCDDCRSKEYLARFNHDINRLLSYKYNFIKNHAKSVGVLFVLTKEYFIELYYKQNGLCFYTNKKMDLAKGNGLTRLSMSVDKIVPDKGYVVGNIVFCTIQANTMKIDLSLEEVKRWLPIFYDKIMIKLKEERRT